MKKVLPTLVILILIGVLGTIFYKTYYVKYSYSAEKADVNASGAYPAMAQAFVNFMGTGFRYVNREDDAGDEGIRYSKLNYKPIELIPKYLVTVYA